MRNLTALACFLLMLVSARAQLTFTVNATANSTGSGYTSGQSATFTFTMTGSSLAGNVNNGFSGKNEWWEDITADTQIFTSITGTGLSGVFKRANATSNDPFSYIQTLGNLLTIIDGAESSSAADIGLALTLGGTKINYVLAGNMDWGATLATPGSYSSPTTYFSSFLGTHALNAGGYFDINPVSGPVIHFTATSLTISAIPEPSTYALLAGGMALVGVGIRRHRRILS